MIYANVGTSSILNYTKEVLLKFGIKSYVLISYLVYLVAFQAFVWLGCYTRRMSTVLEQK